jgi:hypothetical protein
MALTGVTSRWLDRSVHFNNWLAATMALAALFTFSSLMLTAKTQALQYRKGHKELRKKPINGHLITVHSLNFSRIGWPQVLHQRRVGSLDLPDGGRTFALAIFLECQHFPAARGSHVQRLGFVYSQVFARATWRAPLQILRQLTRVWQFALQLVHKLVEIADGDAHLDKVKGSYNHKDHLGDYCTYTMETFTYSVRSSVVTSRIDLGETVGSLFFPVISLLVEELFKGGLKFGLQILLPLHRHCRRFHFVQIEVGRILSVHIVDNLEH